jgi:hypothetical protein
MDIFPIFKHALVISMFVFTMMLLVDFIDTISKQKLSEMIQGGSWRQYMLSSFLGSTPGCLGAFMNVSLYVHGMISFGAIVGGMIATSGDEAFVMLAEFPDKAMLLFILLFFCGVFFAWIADRLIGLLKITPCESCESAACEQCKAGEQVVVELGDILHPMQSMKNFLVLTPVRCALLSILATLLMLIIIGVLGPEAWGWKKIIFIILAVIPLYLVTVVSEHYLITHIWEHIIKGHLLQVFLWTFGALAFVHFGLTYWDLNAFIQQHMLWTVLMGAVIGLIPESGPHMIIVMMYAQGVVPFSVLFTASFVQDGHGMLPMLSYSLKDSLLIKLFNLVFGVLIGVVLYFFGI